MYKAREKVLWFAVVTRALIIFLQFIFNFILPDHDAGVFISPIKHDPEESSVYDTIINYLFGGLGRWDAQYFTHISMHGYSYENTLAFSPLYPIIVRYMSMIIKTILFPLNHHSTTILAALIVNYFCFVKSAAVLYDLSKIVLKDYNLAYRAAILYCINPASIFFSAFYTEAMFAFVSFNVMLSYCKNNPYIYFPIGLSTIVRSNGLINLGFPVYAWVKCLLRFIIPKLSHSKKYQDHSKDCSIPYRCTTISVSTLWLLNIIFLSLVPYILLQIYNYTLFCTLNEIKMSELVINYGVTNEFVIAGRNTPPWCEGSIPTSYSYVQKKYWDVGFLSYYSFKQIPNFLLALPILYVILSRSFIYLREYKAEIITLGCFSCSDKGARNKKQYPLDMFVFVIHGLFLTVFCIFFVHIQVSTRLLCSASPLLYWYCAYDMSHNFDNNQFQHDKDFECLENRCSKWKVFFLSQNDYHNKDLAILSYFFGYIIVGCIMFPNFLPWT